MVDKPAGVTSNQVVGKARWALQAQKAGHAGTLDPLATGVLAVAFGEATKTVPHVMDSLKCYRFTVRWGEARNTDDTEGEVIAASDARPSAEAINAALQAYRGDIMQTPPQFSAVKIDGERAYALARGGHEVEIAARPLWVESLDLIETPGADHAVLEMVCGKGGYVRAIARDLGRDLGCHGHVTALRRLWAGPFEVSDGVSMEVLDAWREAPDQARLIPVAAGLDGLERVPVSMEMAAHLRLGRATPVAHGLEYGEECWAALGDQPVAICVCKGGKLHPFRVIAPPAASGPV